MHSITTIVIRNQREYVNLTRFFLELLGLCTVPIALFAGIAFLSQYGPLSVLGYVGCFIGFFYWKNESRKTGHRQFDDRVNSERQRKAIEEYVLEVRARNVED